jgi:hypothetical protein
MQKIALNKYENYLMYQPKDRKFSDPRVQRAFNNLQKSKTNLNNAQGIKDFAVPSPTSRQAAQEELIESTVNVRKNRRVAMSAGGVGAKSPFSNTRDVLDGRKALDLTKKLVRKDNIKPGVMPHNKFLNKARMYIKKNPGKSGLMALGAGAALGVSAYGWKKELEQ